MNEILLNLKESLSSENFTIVIRKDDKFFSSYERGVNPLIHLIDNDLSFLENSSVADKVIGKAAAMLMVLGKIKEVHTIVISEPAIEVFKKFNIAFHFDKKVKNIINRQGDGLCPMEQLCLDIEDPDVAYIEIKKLIEKLRKNS